MDKPTKDTKQKASRRKELTPGAVNAAKPAADPYEIADTKLRGFLLRVQPSGAKLYYLSFTSPITAKRARYSIGQMPVSRARDVAERLAARVALGEDPCLERKATKEAGKAAQTAAKAEVAKTLRAFLDNPRIDADGKPLPSYSAFIASKRSGPATVARIKSAFACWIETKLDTLDWAKVDVWKHERAHKDKASPHTIARDLVALRSLLSTAVRWQVIAEHPLPAKSKARERLPDNKRVRFLAPDEEKRLRQALRARDARLKAGRVSGNQWRAERGRAPMPEIPDDHFADYLEPLVITAMNTGMRRGELLHLRWADVDLARRTVRVRATTSKTEKTRSIPLNDEAHRVLSQWHRQREKGGWLVFPGRNGQVMQGLKTAYNKLVDDAQVEDFGFHDLRHHFASQLVMRGVHLLTVKELLGHHSVTMTERYAHLAAEHRVEAVALLGRK